MRPYQTVGRKVDHYYENRLLLMYNTKDFNDSNSNRPFLSSRNSHFQHEAKCKTFLVKMSFICMTIKNHVHINSTTSFPGRGENLGTRLINSVTLSLALKQRLGTNRKWPVFELIF